MKYYEIVRFCFILTLFLGGLFVVYKSRLNIILSVNIHNDKQEIYLNIIYLFNIIKIKIPIYSTINKKKKNTKIKKKKDKDDEKLNKEEKENKKSKEQKKYIKEIRELYKIIKNIKVKEFYSKLEFGNENMYFTCFINVFVNIVYGNIGNIINANKMYLSITPNFTQNYIKMNLKVHISPKIEDICKLIKVLIKVYIKNKGGGQNESSRVNTKSYGNNS